MPACRMSALRLDARAAQAFSFASKSAGDKNLARKAVRSGGALLSNDERRAQATSARSPRVSLNVGIRTATPPRSSYAVRLHTAGAKATAGPTPWTGNTRVLVRGSLATALRAVTMCHVKDCVR